MKKEFRSIEELRKLRLKFYGSWTQLVNLIVVKSWVLIVLQTNNLKGNKVKYIIDIYNRNGDLIIGGIKTDYRLLCKDKGGDLYFLIYTDEEEAIEKSPQYIIGVYSLKLK